MLGSIWLYTEALNMQIRRTGMGSIRLMHMFCYVTTDNQSQINVTD